MISLCFLKVFTRLPVVVSAVVTVVAAIVIAFVFGWQLAFLLVAMVPLIIASGYFEMKMQFGKQMRDTELLEEAGKIASEAVDNIRTVQALTRELTFYQTYSDLLLEPFKFAYLSMKETFSVTTVFEKVVDL